MKEKVVNVNALSVCWTDYRMPVYNPHVTLRAELVNMIDFREYVGQYYRLVFFVVIYKVYIKIYTVSSE